MELILSKLKKVFFRYDFHGQGLDNKEYVRAVMVDKNAISASVLVFTIFLLATGHPMYHIHSFPYETTSENQLRSYFAGFKRLLSTYGFTVLINSVDDNNRCMILSQTRSFRSKTKIAKQSNNSGRRSVKRHNLRNCVAKSNHKLSTRCSSSYLPSLLSNITTFVRFLM